MLPLAFTYFVLLFGKQNWVWTVEGRFSSGSHGWENTTSRVFIDERVVCIHVYIYIYTYDVYVSGLAHRPQWPDIEPSSKVWLKSD